MYGTQTLRRKSHYDWKFENDVEMYGTQTETRNIIRRILFENDVEMYGTQTINLMKILLR